MWSLRFGGWVWGSGSGLSFGGLGFRVWGWVRGRGLECNLGVEVGFCRLGFWAQWSGSQESGCSVCGLEFGAWFREAVHRDDR